MGQNHKDYGILFVQKHLRDFDEDIEMGWKMPDN